MTVWRGIVFTLLLGIGVAGPGRQRARDPQLPESRRLLVTLFMAAALLLYGSARRRASITVT